MDQDVRARRRVADQVRNAVISGSIAPVMAAHAGEPERAADLTLESAIAASAVVLASDLRAPSALDGIVADRCDAFGGLAISGRTHYVSPNRQGWRARLANVERLLAVAGDGTRCGECGWPYEDVIAALVEVRAMLDERP